MIRLWREIVFGRNGGKNKNETNDFVGLLREGLTITTLLLKYFFDKLSFFEKLPRQKEYM
jgi:hypothetical protein